MLHELPFAEAYAVMPDIAVIQTMISKVVELSAVRVQTEVLGNDDPDKRLYAYKDICKYYLHIAIQSEMQYDNIWFDVEAISGRLAKEKLYGEQKINFYLEQLATLQAYILDKALQLQEVFARIEGKEPEAKPFEYPMELQTDDALKIFELSVAKGLMVKDGERYKWQETRALYGYFVDKVSKKLDVRPSSDRIPWKLFSTIITNHDELVSTARQAVNDYKNKELSRPEGFLIINGILKA